MSELGVLFGDTVDRLFSDLCDTAMIEAAERAEFPQTLWGKLEDLGVLSMMLEERDGGAGAVLADVVAVLRVAGRHAAPGPILETILARKLLAQAGLDRPAGACALAFMTAESPAAIAVRWGRAVEAVVVVREAATGGTVSVLTAGDHRLELGSDSGFEPRDLLTITPGVVSPSASLPDNGCGRGFRAAGLLRAAQILGALEWCLDRTVAFAGERQQFGQAIGRFQAIQQHLASLAGEVAAASAIVGAAAAESAGGEAGELLVAAARSRVSDAVDQVRWLSHQVHGAIGFTREYPLNLRTRRLTAWRDDFGTTPYWRGRVAEQFVGQPGDNIWPRIVGVT